MKDADRRSPNLLLIGAPRCASTSLAMAMAQHPDLYLCTPKEPHFLAMHDYAPEIGGLGNETFARRNRLTQEQWLDLFAGRRERWLMDASVSTISYPETAIPNIGRHCGDAIKIVVILRNPVERAFSSYHYCRSKGWDSGSFEHCLEQEKQRIAQNWQHLWFLKTLSRYERILPPFLDAFGAENVHVVITEEFAADPVRVLRGLFAFLDLPAIEIAPPRRYNASGVPKSRIVRGVVDLARRRPALRKALVAVSSASFRERFKPQGAAKPEMAKTTRARLSRDLAETKPWVEDLLGRKLDIWT